MLSPRPIPACASLRGAAPYQVPPDRFFILPRAVASGRPLPSMFTPCSSAVLKILFVLRWLIGPCSPRRGGRSRGILASLWNRLWLSRGSPKSQVTGEVDVGPLCSPQTMMPPAALLLRVCIRPVRQVVGVGVDGRVGVCRGCPVETPYVIPTLSEEELRASPRTHGLRHRCGRSVASGGFGLPSPLTLTLPPRNLRPLSPPHPLRR